MDVEDRGALCDALGRLVGAHGEQADRLRGLGDHREEGLEVGHGHAAVRGHGGGRLVGLGQFGLNVGEAGDVGGDVGAVHGAAPDQVGQEAVPQPHVTLRRQRKVQVGSLGGVGAARIDHHMTLPSRPGGLHPAEQHRMRPGGVVAGEDHQVGEVQVLVAARHQVGSEGQLVGHHRRGHAEPRIRVDVP